MCKRSLKIMAIISFSLQLAIWPSVIGWCDQAQVVAAIIQLIIDGLDPRGSRPISAPPWPYPDTPYKESPWPYREMIFSWEYHPYHQIDELLKYGNWGKPTRVFKCPKECEGEPTVGYSYKLMSETYDVSEIYVWRIVGYTKPPKLVLDEKARKYKDDYTLGSNNICQTKVVVASKGKKGTLDDKSMFDYTDIPKGRIAIIFGGYPRELDCHELIRAGV